MKVSEECKNNYNQKYAIKMSELLLLPAKAVTGIWLIVVAARCKVWICGRSLAGIMCPNPTGGMDISLF